MLRRWMDPPWRIPCFNPLWPSALVCHLRLAGLPSPSLYHPGHHRTTERSSVSVTGSSLGGGVQLARLKVYESSLTSQHAVPNPTPLAPRGDRHSVLGTLPCLPDNQEQSGHGLREFPSRLTLADWLATGKKHPDGEPQKQLALFCRKAIAILYKSGYSIWIYL